MSEIEYSGRDNLDIMACAHNYNGYLMSLVFQRFSKHGALVDFGAGNGTFAAPAVAAGYDVLCIETDPVLGKILEDKQLKVQRDLESVADNSLTGIYSFNVLEHIEDDDAVLSLWHRKLTPGGKLLIYVPAFPSLYSSMDRKVGHHRRYRKSGLRAQLLNAGFTVDNIKYADSLGFFATIVYRLHNNGEGNINPRSLQLYDKWIFPLSLRLDKVLHFFLGKNVYAFASKT
ncbi:SAM-dependent methyltransferase [Hydrogenophaga palleronii]|uniref:SAM-dependent methyltransferase n=1 Tax=Hydrogenophaga palleronii TaxID=65655 RepID=A0ABU1WG97_9BURK|nr:class I SAM-dependent methyltransferase [Hydrogenophaga palleronii]MDR7148288.1 SAM-dependent methyltransferase [Hydrogenophaga palleronii]